jgi:hypothetical protein
MGVAEAWTLLSLGLVVIGIRVYVRWTAVGPGKFQLDDYLMPLTGVSISSSASTRMHSLEEQQINEGKI